jgi:hypothetical protein
MKHTDDYVEIIRLMKIRQEEAEQTHSEWIAMLLPDYPFTPASDDDAARYLFHLLDRYFNKWEDALQKLKKRYNYDALSGGGKIPREEEPREDFCEQLDAHYLYSTLVIETALSIQSAQIAQQTAREAVITVHNYIKGRIPGLIAEGRYRGTISRYGRNMAILDATAYVSRKMPQDRSVEDALSAEQVDEDTGLFPFVAEALETYQHINPKKRTVEGFNALIRQVKYDLVKNLPEQYTQHYASMEAMAEEREEVHPDIDPIQDLLMRYDPELDKFRTEEEQRNHLKKLTKCYQLRGFLSSLPKRQLEVLALCEGMKLTDEEAGQHLGITTSTVKKVLGDVRMKKFRKNI